MNYLIAAVLLGFVSGLRSMVSPAAAAWGVRQGVLAVAGTPVAFMGYAYSAIVFTVLAGAELINDKLPWTKSRLIPPQFIGRVLSGGLVGACAAASHNWIIGALAGALAAVAGTLGGAKARGKLAAMFGKDLPAALLEDVTAIALCALALMVM